MLMIVVLSHVRTGVLAWMALMISSVSVVMVGVVGSVRSLYPSEHPLVHPHLVKMEAIVPRGQIYLWDINAAALLVLGVPSARLSPNP